GLPSPRPALVDRTRAPRSRTWPSTRSGTAVPCDPHAVLVDDASVDLDPSAVAYVLHDVPVDRGLVHPAQVGEPGAEGDVDRAVDLLVEVGVSHVPGDARIAADPEFADAPRAGVGVQGLDEERLLRVGRGVRDDAVREPEPDPAHVPAVPDARELAECDRAFGRRLDRAAEELAAGHVAGSGVDLHPPAGERE